MEDTLVKHGKFLPALLKSIVLGIKPLAKVAALTLLLEFIAWRIPDVHSHLRRTRLPDQCSRVRVGMNRTEALDLFTEYQQSVSSENYEKLDKIAVEAERGPVREGKNSCMLEFNDVGRVTKAAMVHEEPSDWDF